MSKRNFKLRQTERRKIIYYTDELNDEFSTAIIQPKKIDKSYVYVKNSVFRRFTHFFWYRIVAFPIAFLYTKLAFHHKTENEKILRAFPGKGYFIYGNHTQDIGDAFIPNMLNKSRDKYVIVHPNNVSIPLIGRVARSLGALPLPDDKAAYANFTRAIEQRITEGKAVVIYPEAHIWPYYTGIRPFTDTSFHYPVKFNTPVFCFTNTYRKRRFGKKPRIVTCVDGPFFPNEELSPKQRRKDLRDRVYNAMLNRAQASDCVTIQYIKKESEQ